MDSSRWLRVLLSTRFAVGALFLGSSLALPASAQMQPQVQPQTQASGLTPPAALGSDVLDAIAKAEREHAPGSKELARALEPLVNRLRESKRFDEAATVAVRILGIELVVYGQEHLEVVGTYAGLAQIKVAAGQFVPALRLHERSLAILENMFGPEHVEVAKQLDRIGAVYRAMGQYPEALPFYERSLAIYEKRLGPDDIAVASNLHMLAFLYIDTRQYSEALPLQQRSLAIYEKVFGSEQNDVATGLMNLAHIYTGLGQVDSALLLAQRGVSVLEKLFGPENLTVAIGLGNVAQLYSKMGRFAQALSLQQRSLSIHEKELGSDHLDLATSLNNTASIYAAFERLDQALPLYQRSLAIFEKQLGSETLKVATILNNLAALYDRLGQSEAALPLAQRSLAIFERRLGPEHVEVAKTLNNVAFISSRLQRFEQAVPIYQRTLGILEKQLGAQHVDVATVLDNLALVYFRQGDYESAKLFSGRALAMILPNDATAWIRQAHGAELHRRLGEPELAIYWGKEAVNGLQGLRKNISSLDKELQTSFLKNKAWPYTQLADALISEGRIPEAQEVLQMLKERELYDDVLRAEQSEPSSLQATLVGVERAKHDQYYRIRDQQVALANERRQIQAVPASQRTPAQRQRLIEIEKQFESVRAAMNQFMASLQQDLKGMRRGEADTAPNVSSTQSALRDVVEELAAPGAEPDARAVALQYVVTDKRVSIILTVPGGPEVARQIDIDYERLAKLITQFTEDVKSPKKPMDGERGLRNQARELHRILIEPVLPDLRKANARTVMLSLTDVLRFMPFAALYDGKRYLIEDYTLSLFNEAATKLERPSRAKWRVAGFGLSEPVERLAALNEVPNELTGVTRPWSGSGMWLNNAASNPFTLDTFQSALGGSHDVLHLASHFVVELGNTAGSRLYLGDKSTLSLEQIRGRDMRFNRIDLVTLSACETAVGGGRTSYGQEMESLGATVQKSGAAAVMATLWKVADRSTGSLMATFYETKSRGANKAEALRGAQLALLNGQVRLSKQQDWSHPFYWAPFVLMGNWR